MECINCPYYYRDEGEKWSRCHCTEPEGLAPCEIDDDEEYEEEEEENEDD